MLVEEACSDKEINERLQQDIIGARSLSQDTICIYINTLRTLGCSISRPSKNNDYKYVLKSHPFKLKLDNDEVYTLVEVRKYISTLDDWRLMVNVDNLYNEIIDQLDSDQKKKFTQTMKNCLRDIEVTHKTQLISLLEKYCSKKHGKTGSYFFVMHINPPPNKLLMIFISNINTLFTDSPLSECTISGSHPNVNGKPRQTTANLIISIICTFH